jgi:hypothetical protein
MARLPSCSSLTLLQKRYGWSVRTSVSIADSLALGFTLWSFDDMSMIVWTYDGVTIRDCVLTLCRTHT